ncbi:hypothetical protein [Aquamicrobium sp. LC103]|uniref:hypothetical protein n=1 Tax=Aquamicrobium sp. LC103 TaxID=1120658 RepID=UPI00063EB2BB|nr:hypothetical protein [Aquamicrobium sp. LC103]TKT79993.1 hypothetical protein XW59_006425 [Aquamicrobium sp. LC103]
MVALSEHYVDLRDWLIPTGAPGSDVQNNAAMVELRAYLIANPGKTVVGHKGDIYKISGTTQYIWPAGTRFCIDGGRFQWNGDYGGGASNLFVFSSGCSVEGLEIEILAGSAFRRLVDFLGNCDVSDLYVHAEQQIGNSGSAPLLDYAVRFYYDSNRVRRARAKNIDFAFFAYGGADAMPGIGNRFDGVEVESYVNGFTLRNLTDVRNIGFRSKTRSLNATQDPGHNGLLHGAVQDYTLTDFKVRDAGEHGVRFGGARGAEQHSRSLTITGGTIERSGQSGLKFFNGAAGQRFTDVNASAINVIDCQYEPENPTELPGFNDEGFLLQQIQNGTFTGLSSTRAANPTGFGSDCSVIITTSSNVLVDGLLGGNPRRNLIRIQEFDDAFGTGHVERLSSNVITIKGAVGYGIGQDGVYLDHPTQPMRDFDVDADMIGSGAAGFYALNGSASAARYMQPVLLRVKQRNFAAGLHGLPTGGNPNLKIVDLFA